LIVSTQERPGDHEHFGQNIVVDSAAIAMQRVVQCLACELTQTEVTALLVYLGFGASVSEAEMNYSPSSHHHICPTASS